MLFCQEKSCRSTKLSILCSTELITMRGARHNI
jgi:hypothetical protein